DFDFWGKTRNAIAASTSEAKASQADLAAARLTLSTAVAAAYADLSRLYAERDVTERSVQSRLETLDQVSRRVTNGLDTRAELKQAEAGVPAARADLAAIDEQIGQTRNELAALLGQGPDRGLAIARPAATQIKAFGLPQTLAADLIGRRPDIVAARWRAEAAAKRIGVAKAQFYPDINLTAAIGYQSLYLKELFASGSDMGQVGPALTLPIFEGGRLRSNLKGAQADYASAVASYDQTLTQALREVADAAVSERALTVRLKESQDALAAEEESYKVARARYEGGLANYQTVLTAEDRVLQSRRTVVDLRARALTLDIQLIKALGGGFADA
ncbi:MAG: efflux transporter outer membrane subunit, partial [Caulobacteraceae bacterium]|nr:efflux transporter outer membrane subunit [Caulobacteraceae bacterium]